MSEEIKNELPCKKMTLDEAIDHCESCIDNTPCGQEHKQLAEWLKELQARQKFDEASHHYALVDDRRPLVEVLRIGRSFQYSVSNYRGAAFDTTKLLCDTLELLMPGCSGKMYKALLELRKTIVRIGANGKTCSSELSSMMGLIDGALIEKPRNIDLFNSGDIKQDINDAIAAFTKETGKSVYNCCEGFNSVGDFVAWLFAKWYKPGLGIDDIEKMKICEK